MAPTLEQWREHLTTDITIICERPTMFGPDPEGLVVTQLQNWQFVLGQDPLTVMPAWRLHVFEAGYKMGCLAFLRDLLTNEHHYNMDPQKQFYEIEHIVGKTLAGFARTQGLDVPDPTRHPDRESAPEASATSEAST